MIGDRSWAESLWARYEQHIADAQRRGQVSRPYKAWAIDATWRDFCNLAHFVNTIPKYSLDEWERRNPVPIVSEGHYSSIILARRFISGLILVNALMAGLKRCSLKAHAAVKQYLEEGRVPDASRPALSRARKYVYAWLVRAAEQDRANAKPPQEKNPAAVALGRLGGRARAAKLAAQITAKR